MHIHQSTKSDRFLLLKGFLIENNKFGTGKGGALLKD